MANTKPHASQIRYGSGDNRVDKTLKCSVLSFSDYAAASAAAATLPDGQVVEAPDADGRLARYQAQGGVLVFKRMASNVASIMEFGARGDGIEDDTAAIQTAINTGLVCYVPETSAYFKTTSKLVPVSGGGLIGPGIIRLVGATTDSVIEATNVDSFVLDGPTLDGDNTTKTSGSHGVKATNCNGWKIGELTVINPQNWGVAFYGGQGNEIGTLIVEDAKTSSALMFLGSSNNDVGRVIARRCGGFGVQIFDGSIGNHIGSIEAIDTGLEALGINSTSHQNRIGAVSAIRCRDNGVSISGDFNQVDSVYSEGVHFHGACFYGSDNQIGAVVARNIGQNTYTAHAGVAFIPAFGGKASRNVVGVLNSVDDQGTKTTAYAAFATNNQDPNWTAGQTVAPTSWRKNGSYFYQTTLGGVCGSTPPTHTSGDATDGGVVWTYKGVVSPAVDNHIGPVSGYGWLTGKFSGMVLGSGNFFGDYGDLRRSIIFGATAGVERVAGAWASGQTVNYGAMRSNAGNVYICVSASGNCVNAPTHSSGTSTGADGISWRFEAALTANTRLLFNQDNTLVSGILNIQNIDSGNAVASILAGNGTPETKAVAATGSLYGRTDGQLGIEAYLKTVASGSNGWLPIALRRSGTTSNRPVIPSGSAFSGITYFDTTLGKPIWSNSSSGWVDATGASV